jgi:2-hydroxychromene-2-carboxylate isomerase
VEDLGMGSEPAATERRADLRNEMNPLVRFISSQVSRILISPRRRRIGAHMREFRRCLSGAPHRVRYFHQVDDPYSHLAAQTLGVLCDRYDIELIPDLVSAEAGASIPEPELLAALAIRDCAEIAPHYGLQFAGSGTPKPTAEAIRAVERALVAASSEGTSRFAERAVELGRALWSGDEQITRDRCGALPAASEAATAAALAAGNALRRTLGHYSGAMFQHAGEWYWGVDRLCHLESRLAELGASRLAASPCHPRPELPMVPVERSDELRLEIFPSLRSPYSAIGFEPAVDLAKRTGVPHVVRPVLPMVMRGVPVPFMKAKYILLDTHRESRHLNMPFGRIFDPVGEPVRRGYSLWPWARAQGHGEAFIAAFLRAAFSEGIDTGSDAGLRRVVERAGLDWGEAQRHVGEPGWEAELEANRLAMIEELGSWGVPSFRLSGPVGEPDLCVWGQDRLWLVGREIQRRGGAA